VKKLSGSSKDVQDAVNDLDTVYKEFLTDFLITEKGAMYRLSEIDSMIINLSPDNFVPPIGGNEYYLQFQDTLGLKVECPLLADFLEKNSLPYIEEAKTLPIIPAFEGYLAQLDSVRKSYLIIKEKYRRNTEIFIKTKELDLSLEKLNDTQLMGAYKGLYGFVYGIPGNKSYSSIFSKLDSALISVGAFKQVYTDNFFGKFDSTHSEIKAYLEGLNEILSNIRRNTITVDAEIAALETAINQIHSISGSQVNKELTDIENGLKDLFLQAADGISEPVYGVFSKTIRNHGHVYGRTARKSWEE